MGSPLQPDAIAAERGAVRTTCPYCGVGCGVLATPDGRGGAAIAGDPDHPANGGRLCSKGSALGETLGLDTRLLHPVVDGRRTDWSAALDRVASGLAAVREAHGPQAIAVYLSGQLLTEDYYVANKLAKGFLGTPHVDTNSRLCMASSVAGHKRAFGADVVPQCYDDVEIADLVVLVGSNAAWCHPILYQRIQMARAERGMRVVSIDPRLTATSEGCDLNLQIRPGTDQILFNGLLVWLEAKGLVDRGFVERHTSGFTAALDAARASAPSTLAVAKATGLDIADVELLFTWFGSTRRVVTCYSQGVNQSAQGTDKVNAIVNCHLATGMIGRPGAGPLSFTGQPNAMGGREVGGLANMLAAHMGFSAPERDRVARFWNAPALVAGEGLKAVAMFDAIARGEIRALWVMGTNPAVSLPTADAVRAALGKLDLLVVSDNVVSTDTLASAHVLLPAAAWGEKDGTVTNSERRISRQRAFLPLPGEAKPDWWILSEVARRLGHGAAFPYSTVGEIFDEHARLSGFENDPTASHGRRAFDISGLAGLDARAFDALEPVQWPMPADGAPQARLFSDGSFFTDDRRGRFIAIAAAALAAPVSAERPFVLNTGRVRDQWHTMTRTGLSPRLSTHIQEPFVEIHPDDASRLGLEQGTLARVETGYGSAVLRVLLSRGQQPGCLFVPIHWSAENASAARTSALVHPVTDPYSGQPEAKATPATIAPLRVSHYGIVVSRPPLRPAGTVYWSAARTTLGGGTADPGLGHILNVCLDIPAADAGPWLRASLPGGDWITLDDPSAGIVRAAVTRDGRLEAVAFLGPTPKLPPVDWVRGQFADVQSDPAARRAILAGRPATGGADEGPIVCVCYQVGSRRIVEAARGGCTTTQEIGAALGAGTNCGSCLPEIKRLLASAAQRRAAE
jgi:assimilatory nitrate reductase catalytic subunit